MNTAVNSKRVFYVAPHRPQGFAEMLGKRDDVRLDLLEQKTPDDAALESVSARALRYRQLKIYRLLRRRWESTTS